MIVNAIHPVSDASDKISKIIGVIDEIAFQTNIPALNAARAGEAGRAVAADAVQIKTLADQMNSGSSRQSAGIGQVARAIAATEHSTQRSSRFRRVR